MAKGRRDPNFQRKELLNHQPVPPDQSSECWKKDFRRCGGPKTQHFCRATTSLTYQCRRLGYVVSQDVRNMQMSSCTRYKLPRRKRALHVVFLDFTNASASVPHKTLDSFQLRPRGHQKAGQSLLSGSLVLHHNTGQHHCLAAPWNRHNGGLYHFSPGIHHGNGVHHSSITMGGQRGTLEEWAVFSSNRGVHGWYDHNNTNKSMSPTACWINFKETSNGHESNTADPAVFSVSKAGSQTKDSASMISQYQLSWRSPSKASDDGTT